MFHLGIITFINQLIYIIFAAMARMYAAIVSNCRNGNIDQVHASLSTVAISGFFMQYLLLLLVMFIRLKHLFQSTPFRISKYTAVTFFVLFTCTLILCLLYAVLYLVYYTNADSELLTILIG